MNEREKEGAVAFAWRAIDHIRDQAEREGYDSEWRVYCTNMPDGAEEEPAEYVRLITRVDQLLHGRKITVKEAEVLLGRRQADTYDFCWLVGAMNESGGELLEEHLRDLNCGDYALYVAHHLTELVELAVQAREDKGERWP